MPSLASFPTLQQHSSPPLTGPQHACSTGLEGIGSRRGDQTPPAPPLIVARDNGNNRPGDAKLLLQTLGMNRRRKSDPYIDVAALRDPDAVRAAASGACYRRTPEQEEDVLFPDKLHRMLLEIEEAGEGWVASFLPHGRAFRIHKPEVFQQTILPRYFGNTKWKSFCRQLQMYGFLRVSSGNDDAGGYYHELFLKTRPSLCRYMHRTTNRRQNQGAAANTPGSPPTAASAAAVAAANKRNDGQDPDFYSMQALPTDLE